MNERLPPSVRRDLSRELGDRVGVDIRRVAGLATDHTDMFEISLSALTTAVASTGAFCAASCGTMFDPYDVAILLLSEMKDARTPEQRAALHERLSTIMVKR